MTREDAVKVLNALWKYKNCGFSEKKMREALDMAIEALEQEPKIGHWVIAEKFGFGNICECSECKESVWIYKDTDTWNYCPKCGLKMEEK